MQKLMARRLYGRGPMLGIIINYGFSLSEIRKAMAEDICRGINRHPEDNRKIKSRPSLEKMDKRTS